jgi:hypothetical protein
VNKKKKENNQYDYLTTYTRPMTCTSIPTTNLVRNCILSYQLIHLKIPNLYQNTHIVASQTDSPFTYMNRIASSSFN